MHFSANFCHSSPAKSGDPTVAMGSHPIRSAPPARHPRQLDHDIQHELGTIALLASLLGTADDVGPDSRRRAEQIVEETHWLNRLVRAATSLPGSARQHAAGRYDRSAHANAANRFENWASATNPERSVRMDRIAVDVVDAARLSTTATVYFEAAGVSAAVDPLTFWRVLTNLVGNAVRAAGANGAVHVQVSAMETEVVVLVEDDGPGFGAGPAGCGAYGLDITRDLVLSMAGKLQIGNRPGGGCRVRLYLPAVGMNGIAA